MEESFIKFTQRAGKETERCTEETSQRLPPWMRERRRGRCLLRGRPHRRHLGLVRHRVVHRPRGCCRASIGRWTEPSGRRQTSGSQRIVWLLLVRMAQQKRRFWGGGARLYTVGGSSYDITLLCAGLAENEICGKGLEIRHGGCLFFSRVRDRYKAIVYRVQNCPELNDCREGG